jgi:hypothetical protein
LGELPQCFIPGKLAKIILTSSPSRSGRLFVRPFVVNHNRFGGCFFVERPFIVNLKWLACFFLVRPVILVDLTAFLAFVVVATLGRMFGVIGFVTLRRTLDYFRDRRLRLEPLPFASFEYDRAGTVLALAIQYSR